MNMIGMERSKTASAVSPLLRNRMLRILLIAAPGIMGAAAVMTAAFDPGLGVSVVLNVAAGVIISSILFLAVSLAARQVADDRVSLAKAAEEGSWRARTRLLSIRHEENGLYSDWYFRLRLQEEVDRSARYGLRFTLVLGRPSFIHNELDARATSGLFYDGLRHRLRKSDLPAILKDGTLAILLPHTASGAPIQQRLTKQLASTHLATGVASFPEDGDDVDGLIETAARSAGRPSAGQLSKSEAQAAGI